MTSCSSRKVMPDGTSKRRQIGGRESRRVILILWTVLLGAVRKAGFALLLFAMAAILPPTLAVFRREALPLPRTMINARDEPLVAGRQGAGRDQDTAQVDQHLAPR